MTILLRGVVGSRAHGLSTEDSDVDYLGVYAAPTQAILGFEHVTGSLVTKDPDSTLHEARKFCELALSGNPTVNELLWLPEYKLVTGLGLQLLDIRRAFLSRRRVRDAYLGYATQQFRKLSVRGDGTFSSDIRNRTAKHARHLYRLLHQGFHLYRTGELTVALKPETAAEVSAFGREVAEEGARPAREVLEMYEGLFRRTDSPLPEHPDRATVQEWLLRVRTEFW